MSPKPINESARLANLRDYRILDTLAEPEYDDLVALAAEICQAPVAQINLIDADRQFLKAEYGFQVPGRQLPREDGFCSHTILNPDEPMVISDLRKDKRFQHNRFVAGDPRVVFYAGVPLCSPEGHALGALCVIDQRPRRMKAGQLRALQILSRQVIQLLELRRSLATSQRRLREREYAYRLLKDFSHIIAHDLKAPVRNIRQTAELLREEFVQHLPSDGARLFGMIETRADDAARMIEGVLRYSKVAGNADTAHEPIAIAPLVEEIAAVVGRPDCTVRYVGALERIDSSRVALTHILQNLIGNAVKFNDKAKGEVTVDARSDADGSAYILTVTDNGPGIPPEQWEAVFQLFHVAGQSGQHGHGVGLSIVRRLVEDLHGSITMHSELGRGTTFVVRLPTVDSLPQ